MEPPAHLAASVRARIAREQLKKARWQTLVLGLLSTGLFTLFIGSARYFFQGFSHTEFYVYLSLASSDGGAVLASWREFSLLLVESLPAVQIATVLTILIIFLGSLALAIQHARTVFSRMRFA